MRRTLFALTLVSLLCLSISIFAQSSVTLVTSGIDSDATGGGGTPSSTTSAVTVTTQAGDAIVVCGGIEGTQTATFADDRSNSYSTPLTVSHSLGNGRSSLSYALNVAAGSTVVTMTLSATQYRYQIVSVWRNVATASAEDDTSSNEQGTGSTTFTGVVVDAVRNGVAIGCVVASGAKTITPSGSWVHVQEQETGCCSVGAMEYQLAAASTGYTPGWTSSTSDTYVTTAIILAEAASGRNGGWLTLGVGR